MSGRLTALAIAIGLSIGAISDAFMGLADFAHEIPRIIDENGTERSRLTVGKVE